jgi:hypothetical protein
MSSVSPPRHFVPGYYHAVPPGQNTSSPRPGSRCYAWRLAAFGGGRRYRLEAYATAWQRQLKRLSCLLSSRFSDPGQPNIEEPFDLPLLPITNSITHASFSSFVMFVTGYCLVHRLANNGDVAAGQLAVFQGASDLQI